MPDAHHLAILGQGSKTWNQWRSENPQLAPNLSHSDLKGRELREFNLSGADLHESEMTWAHVVDCNCEGADFSNAVLISTNFTGSELRGTNFRGARLWFTVFGDTNLLDAIGLDSCIHMGPSILDMRTVMRSGSLPARFLWGCGFPDALVQYLPSILSEPVQFYSCFISYSTRDQTFADRLYADLYNQGVRCWFAPHDMQGGKKIHQQIDQAIRVHDRLLLILSEDSMKSSWVESEIARARQRELKERKRVLFPISLVPFSYLRDWTLFDADAGKDSAREIREYFIPDFSNWNDHDSYQKPFARLVRDLRAEENSEPTAKLDS
jgi:hypothetical protein